MFTLSKILFSFVVLSSSMVVAHQKRLSCSGDYKINQQVYGVAHNDIERAGVLMLKNYRQDLNFTNDRYVVLLGYDKNLKTLFPHAGKIDRSDRYTSETASRELKEETGGCVNLNFNALRKLPYLYAGKKQLFFYRNDKLSAGLITQYCQNAQKNPQMSHAYKEMSACYAVPVHNLLRLASDISHGRVKPSNGSYTIYSRSGRKLKINSMYMHMFAHHHNPSRYQASRLLFNNAVCKFF